jgi:hypothetical protein
VVKAFDARGRQRSHSNDPATESRQHFLRQRRDIPFEVRSHGASLPARSRSGRVPLTKPFISGSFFKLTHYRLLGSGSV